MPRTTARRNSNGSRTLPGAYPTNSAVKAELNAGGLPTAAPKGRDAKRRAITRPGVFARVPADCCTAAASAAANRCFSSLRRYDQIVGYGGVLTWKGKRPMGVENHGHGG